MTVTPNWNPVTVRGKYVGMTGAPVVGKVTFTPKASRLIDQAALTTIIGTPISAALGVTGAFSIGLPATDDPDITPSGFTYAVKEDFAGGTSYEISVPLSAVGTGLEIATIAPVPPNAGTGEPEVTRLEFDGLAASVESIPFVAETRTGPASDSPDLILAYDSPVNDPDLYRILYVPPGEIAAGLPEIYRTTFVLNERGFIRLQVAADEPTDTPFKIFGRGDVKGFTSDVLQVIKDRLDQSTIIFAIEPDGRIDQSRYPWTNIDLSGSTGGKYQAPSGTTYWHGAVRRVASDTVEMRGSIDVPGSAVTTADVIGSIPTEFRPSRRARVLSSAGDGAQSVRVEVMTDGTLVARTTRASAAGYLSFDGCTYTL